MKGKYLKKQNLPVAAVQMNLEINRFTYHKWGSLQQAKEGDWLVNNNGNVYTINEKVFASTYEESGLGSYIKTTPIWAEIALKQGVVNTKEGKSHYEAGDYLVSNNEDGSDTYCIPARKFSEMYELCL
jgi:hypothetical protein